MPKAHTMAVARDPTTGAALLSATVNVYTPGTVTPIPATIFDKNNNVLPNPLTSDPVTGLIDFYLTVPQEVDLVVAKALYTTRTYSNVPVLDDASLDLSALLTTTGDVPYASAANTPARLPIGAQGTFYNVGGASIPRWGNTIDAGGLTITSGAITQTNSAAGAVDNLILRAGGALSTDESSIMFANSSGTLTNRIWGDATAAQLRIKAGGTLNLHAGDAGFTTTGLNVTIGATTIGFLGAAAVAIQTLGAASTDLASVITLANNIRTALRNFGLAN